MMMPSFFLQLQEVVLWSSFFRERGSFLMGMMTLPLGSTDSSMTESIWLVTLYMTAQSRLQDLRGNCCPKNGPAGQNGGNINHLMPSETTMVSRWASTLPGWAITHSC